MNQTPAKLPRFAWVDQLKAVALIWIFLNHASERMFGDPYFANPDNHWPSLGQRIAQVRPLTGLGIWNLPANLFRYIGWLGDQGVGLFLILSGFGLAWGYLSRQRDEFSTADFYRRRLMRIYPLWLAAHAVFLLPLAILGWHLSLLDPRLYLSALGVRILPDQMYYGVAAWWYIGLLIQLYLLFPLLWKALQKFGATKFFLLSCAIALMIRGLGLFWFQSYLDAWSRGAIFITRLPEFALGMAIAWWLCHSAKSASRIALLFAGTLAFLVGTAASFTLAGMTIAPLLQSGGTFAVLYVIFCRSNILRLQWIGRHSFSLYLVHQPIVKIFLPAEGSAMGLHRVLVGFVVAIGASIVLALLLEKIVAVVSTVLHRASQHWGRPGLVWRITTIGATVWGLLIVGDLIVRHMNPVEPADLGWGERPSLQPSEEFGWNLRPNQQTHLRWNSYDYTVTANSLGFPGPEYPQQKEPGTFRILVTGDAFTSAEGVDTNQSWPRLLEKQLAASSPIVHPEVLNFAITGYGPNQYLAVVKRFAPQYHPDLILIGLFINDYGDVITTDEQFRVSIGFGLPDPNGLASILTFRQLAGLSRIVLVRNITERLRHKPDPEGYFFGQFHFLERDCPELIGEGRERLAARIAQIKQIADGLGARVAIAMIPAAPQVCRPDQLAYWPKHLDFSDADRFDPDLPQRTTREIAANLSIPCFDLRPALRAVSDGCPYQSRNMHFTAAGHRAAADYLAATLRDTGIYPSTVFTQANGD